MVWEIIKLRKNLFGERKNMLGRNIWQHIHISGIYSNHFHLVQVDNYRASYEKETCDSNNGLHDSMAVVPKQCDVPHRCGKKG